MTNEEVLRFLGEFSQYKENTERRIKTIEKNIDDLRDLVLSVELLAQSVERIAEQIKDHNGRIKTLENKPAKKWDSMVNTIVTSIVSAIGGGLAVALMSLLAK